MRYRYRIFNVLRTAFSQSIFGRCAVPHYRGPTSANRTTGNSSSETVWLLNCRKQQLSVQFVHLKYEHFFYSHSASMIKCWFSVLPNNPIRVTSIYYIQRYTLTFVSIAFLFFCLSNTCSHCPSMPLPKNSSQSVCLALAFFHSFKRIAQKIISILLYGNREKSKAYPSQHNFKFSLTVHRLICQEEPP